jgi:hypothetical protein
MERQAALLSGREPSLSGNRRKDGVSVGQERGSTLLECGLKGVVEQKREAVAARVDWKSLELLIQTRKVLCLKGLWVSGDRCVLRKKRRLPSRLL